MENRCPVPCQRLVAADRAVDNVGIPQAAETAADIPSHISADGAAIDVEGSAEEAVDSAAINPCRGVIADGDVTQIQRTAIPTVDSAAALPVVVGARSNGVIRHGAIAEIQRSIVQDATSQIPAIA